MKLAAVHALMLALVALVGICPGVLCVAFVYTVAHPASCCYRSPPRRDVTVGGSPAVFFFLRGDEFLPRSCQASRSSGALGALGKGAIPAQEPEIFAAANPLPDVRLLSHRYPYARVTVTQEGGCMVRNSAPSCATPKRAKAA